MRGGILLLGVCCFSALGQAADPGPMVVLPTPILVSEYPDGPATRSEWGLSFSDVFPLASSDSSLRSTSIRPDVRRNWSLVGAFGYETFRGVGDNGWQNNGVYGGFNFGARLGSFSQLTGIGVQGGITTGAYDWKGNAYRLDTDSTMQQTFASYGLFKRATEAAPFTLAATQDWMVTENSGAYGLSLAVSQVRYRAGYVCSASNEFGILGALRVVGETNTGVGRGGAVPILNQTVTTRPLNHMSLYWSHKWSAGGAETLIRSELRRTTGFVETAALVISSRRPPSKSRSAKRSVLWATSCT